MKTIEMLRCEIGEIITLLRVMGPEEHEGKYKIKLVWENRTTGSCFIQYVGIPSHGKSKWPELVDTSFRVEIKCQKKPIAEQLNLLDTLTEESLAEHAAVAVSPTNGTRLTEALTGTDRLQLDS
jgi:predicted carbohydrate-binding protein with CBM5 and CBM33 domain